MSEEEEAREHDERFAVFNFGRLVERSIQEDTTIEGMDVFFRPEYPDAVWQIKMKGGEERLVNIEFEGRSSNFRVHQHDPKKCDLIVCTLHDWSDPSLPVLDVIYGRFFKPGEGIKGSFYECILEEIKGSKQEA